MPYNPLNIGDDADNFLEFPVEVNLRLKALWDALEGLDTRLTEIEEAIAEFERKSFSFDSLTDTPESKAGADGKILGVDAVNNKIIFRTLPEAIGGRLNYLLINYHLWKGEYNGNIHFQAQIGKGKDFSGPLDYDLDTRSRRENWNTFDGNKWAAFLPDGMPTTFIQALLHDLDFPDTDMRYIRWRSYYMDEGNPVFGDWTGEII